MSSIAGYSTVGFRDRSLDKALQAIAGIGFKQVELVGVEPHLDHILDTNAAGELRRELDSLGFTETTVHAPMGTVVLGAPEKVWRSEAVETLAHYIRMSAEIGAKGIVIHPVPNPCFVPDPNAPGIHGKIETAVEQSLEELIPIANRAGIRILLENLPYDCSYPLLDMTGLRRLVQDYPEKVLGLVVDTGHAWTSGISPEKEILTAGERLWGTHLQDVDGINPNDNHWAPTRGDLDWSAICNALATVGYGGSWTFESYNPRSGETPEELAVICRSAADSWGIN